MSFALRFVWLVLLLCPAGASAAPVTLKLSFFTSDRSNTYQCLVRPFVDAVNERGAGLVEIKVFFSGAVSTAIEDQPRLVREGTTDLAFTVAGQTPHEFPDAEVLQLPGLYRDEREASLVFTRLADAGALEGYKPFVVVGAYVAAGESILSRKPLSRLAELKGQTIRVNNATEAATLRMLGANAVVMPINRTMDALSEGTIDGVAMPSWMIFEYGFGRLTENHYSIGLSGAPVALIMNREKFASLPHPAQDIIRNVSGEWMVDQEISCSDEKSRLVLAELSANPRRRISEPSAPDLATIRNVYASAVQAWASESSHNRKLLALVMAEIAKLRKETPQ